MGSMLKRIVCLTLVMLSVSSFYGCVSKTPLGNKYSSVTEIYSEAVDEGAKAEQLSFEYKDLTLEYDFSLTCDVGEKIYSMGHNNTVLISGRGTENERAYRSNNLIGLNGEKDFQESFLSGGMIYVKQYATFFKAPCDAQGFLEYTAKDTLSCDDEFFSVGNFTAGCVYICRDGTKEIAFTGENDELKLMIAEYIGLADSSYVYEVRDVILVLTVDGTGALSGKYLMFEVDYHAPASPEAKLTYKGRFSVDVFAGLKGEIKEYKKDTSYQQISDAEWLYSLTDGGYDVLVSYTGLDVVYDKYIKNSDIDEEYLMKTQVHFTESYLDDVYRYGSIDMQTLSTPKTQDRSAEGVFIDADGYHVRGYDIINKKYKDPIDEKESPYTALDMVRMVANTVTSERLISQDVMGVIVTEDDENIVFKYSYSGDAVVYYSEYLLSAFTSNGSGIDLSNSAIYPNSNKGEITIRKSDGCLIKHMIDFSVLVDGAITLESKMTLTVNETGDSVKILTPADFNDKYAPGDTDNT